MKATKRLVKALTALVSSVILCIGVCFAWFATNSKTDASGMNSTIKSSNIIKFVIEAYKLTNKSTQTTGEHTVTSYTVGEKLEGNQIEMAEYGGLVNNSVTALLLKFTYTFDEELNKNYGIYADCKNTRGEIGSEGEGAEMVLNCALSSVIDFYDIGEAEIGTTVTQTTEKHGTAVPDTDGTLIPLKDGITDSAKNGTFYCIIDYNENEIFTQYYKALSIDGTSLSTPMDFLSDIEFYMGESASL